MSGWYGKTIDYKANPNVTYDRFRAGADLQVYLDLLPFGGTALKGDHGLDVGLAANAGKVAQTDEIAVAVHHFVGGNFKLSAAYYHAMNAKKGPTAPSDPKVDTWLAQAQARF